jgi:hypothetical protein
VLYINLFTSGLNLDRNVWYAYYHKVVNHVDFNHPEFKRRIYVEDNVLHFKTLAGDEDFMGGNLHPRAELSFRKSQPIEEEYAVEARLKYNQLRPNGCYFQILGRRRDKSASPVFSFDSFDGNLNARVLDVATGWHVRNQVAGVDEYNNQWLKVRAEVGVSSFAYRGYYKLYINNKLVYEKTNTKTYWSNSSENIYFQFGCYNTNKAFPIQSVEFDYIVFEKLEN